jgi:hypothetical protein
MRIPIREKDVSMRGYACEVARQGQQGGRGASTAASQPPQPQHVARCQLFQTVSAQVTGFRSGVAQLRSEIDGYYSCRSQGTAAKEDSNEDYIEELMYETEEEEKGQGVGSAEEEEESETGEDRDRHIDKEERDWMVSVGYMQAEYAFINGIWKRTDKVTWSDDMWACFEEEVLEVSTSASNQEKRTISKVVAFSIQLAMTDPIENRT